MPRTTTSITRAPFVVDPNSINRNSGRQIDWNQVPMSYLNAAVLTQNVVVAAAGAAGAATTLPVDATTYAIPAGVLLDFGTNKFARTTAAAAAGATSLTVAALPTALVDNDVAVHTITPGSGKKTLPAGTVVGELLGAGLVSPRVVTTNPAIGILETSATEGEPQAALSGYGVIIGGAIYENLLPDATGGPPKVLATAIKTELNANGTGWAFEPYGDDRD